MPSARRRRPAASAAALLVLLLLAAEATAKTPADRCAKPGRQWQASTAVVRIFTPHGSDTTYVCLRASGKVTRLYRGDELYGLGSVLAIRGAFVAYTDGETPACKAACPPEVHGTFLTGVADAATGRRRVLARDLPVALRLRATGTVAFLVGAAAPRELFVWDRAGRRRLDGGAIPPSSVRLTGRTVRWTNAGVARTAVVG